MQIKVIRLNHSDYVFQIINHLFLAVSLIIVLLPLLNVVSQSFSSPKAVISGRVFLWPVEFSTAAYKNIISHPDLINGFLNSIFYTVVGTIVNVILSIAAAYPLSKRDFYGKKFFIGMFVFTMIFSGGMIPDFLLVKSLHLYDTRWALILPNAITVWNVMLARTFFQTTIPSELYEAAEIDGATDFQILFAVALPLAVPIIAVLTLFYAVAHWNSYFYGLIYLRSQNLLPLQVVLRNILLNAQEIQMVANLGMEANSAQDMAMVEVLKYAIIVVASLPVLMLYPFVQKHFVKGIMVGSLKG